MSDLFDITGKTALVTGGSRGIGYMIAEGLVQAGATVLISSRKTEQVEAAAAELSKSGSCEAVSADVSTPDGVAALAAAVKQRSERLDILINNAGVSWGAPLEEFPATGWDRVLGTNVQGLFALTVALLPQLRMAASAADPARVINIGSIDGLRAPAMENYSYSASKGAVHMLTKHLAKRLAGDHITVNAIAPGPFPSKMTAFFLGEQEQRDAVGSAVPLGRVGEASDVAGTAIFLSSRAGAYITGVVLPLDGGITGTSPGSI